MARGDARVYDQMFRGSFLDNDLQYIPTQMVTDATALGWPPVVGSRYAGLDLGLERDRTSLVIVEEYGGLWRVAHLESHPKTDDELIDRLVEQAFTKHGVKRFAVDATGLGSLPAKRMRRSRGPRIDSVVFSNAVKEDLATRLYDVMSQGQLSLPSSYRNTQLGHDEGAQLRDDICSIRRKISAQGTVRYEAPRSDQGHADRAWALMLALYAGKAGGPRIKGYKELTSGFKPAKRRM